MPRATTIQQLPGDWHPGQTGTVMLLVKAQHGAIVYSDDAPIGEDEFQAVELTPTITQAIIDGDLVKEGKPFLNIDVDEQLARATGKPGKRIQHVTVREANPNPDPAIIPARHPEMQQRAPTPPRHRAPAREPRE